MTRGGVGKTPRGWWYGEKRGLRDLQRAQSRSSLRARVVRKSDRRKLYNSNVSKIPAITLLGTAGLGELAPVSTKDERGAISRVMHGEFLVYGLVATTQALTSACQFFSFSPLRDPLTPFSVET
ncbi:hypothetical protein BDM02DRAFT_577205 [Thelephora ganbajun]|uniref:Uncharacterized protein n=1 Tax=Thelephora ganbajun TaxID=370292 RepID=A0ACB6Z7V7_THEGA|nr:hypothetical protein BDM02DRAFT_577205 [Thelephora ganbajun]